MVIRKKKENNRVRSHVLLLGRRSWLLACIDALTVVFVCILTLSLCSAGDGKMPAGGVLAHCLTCAVVVLGSRACAQVYRQVWRYANTRAYLLLCMADVLAALFYIPLAHAAFPPAWRLSLLRALAILAFSLLISLGTRFVYHYLREKASRNELPLCFKKIAGRLFSGNYTDGREHDNRTKIAIVGGGRVGAMLAEELMNNSNSRYAPVCFVETDKVKVGRDIMGLPVLDENAAMPEILQGMGVQEVVFAMPQMPVAKKKKLYDNYTADGFKVKVFDYPLEGASEKSRRTLREFDIEELLFRSPKQFITERARAAFRDKVVLVSGGGGSIGSELCRQVAKMHPRKLIVLDIYENNAYDIQQELKIAYGDQLDLQVEIASVRDKKQLDKVFGEYRPQIVLHAAAHKHVPLMEHNVSESVKNNVFGTMNIVDTAEEYGVERFIMVSTDKAVNPTNVMGATKRMCEMIVQSRVDSKTCFSATRFGNVLGSNGSVIPLFKRQIASGGPVTLTDKRIIRYFMTIPEASQLVLQSAAMAHRGELYVLDMGKPVRILDLAENMIRLMGYEPYKDIEIKEIGLRPGEKLYEELLIKTEELDKTDSDMIFVERDKPLSRAAIDKKLAVLQEALDTGNDDVLRDALKRVVPTYRSPKQVNEQAMGAEEMKEARNSDAQAQMAG